MIPERTKILFWKKVSVLSPDECWEWQGKKYKNGYGSAKNIGPKGKERGPHRIAWVIVHGDVPQGLHVLHHCDNRICCNPKHLFLGTHQDNMYDRNKKNRQAKGSSIGTSKLSESQVLAIKLDGRSNRKIAVDYGISQSCVSRIKSEITWKHVQPEEVVE